MKLKVQSSLTFSVLLLLCLVCQLIQAQELHYDAFMKGKKVGELIATREVNDENTKIIVKTKVEAHLIVKISVEVNTESFYIDQSLMQSSAITRVHNEVRSDVQMIKKSNSYVVDVDGRKKEIRATSILGADIFYFEEPKNIKTVYALATGEQLKVEKGGESIYFFERDGKKEYHKYLNGTLTEVEINHALYSITFKLKKN